MGYWENLPFELLAMVYAYLPRRDRLACSLVCDNWKMGLDHVMLWRTMVVHADTDLMEPSTILLMRDYCKYVKYLEFGWMSSYSHQEVIKKATRFFIILYDSHVQLRCLRIFNGNNFVFFRKITYHVSRFLKIQLNLMKVVLDNCNMATVHCFKLLASCLSSKSTITYLELRSCYHYQNFYNLAYFRSCIEQLTWLKTLKLDYFVLSCDVINSILTSKNCCLEHLEINIKETAWYEISDGHWKALCTACPKLTVTFVIKNICYHDELRVFLKHSVPLASFSIVLPNVYERERRWNFRKTMNLLINNYCKTLVYVNVHITSETEILDDLILKLFKRCSRLKSFIFNGIMESPQILRTTFQDVKCYYMLPNAQHKKHLVLSPLCPDDLTTMKHKRVQVTIVIKHQGYIVCSVIVLN